MSTREPASVVILTRDESANLPECVEAVLDQLAPGDEIVIVDSGSTDGTVQLAADYAQNHPARVRVHAFPVNVSFGEARNAGVSMARGDIVVFVSADAVPARGWLDALRKRAARADVVYGRQAHAPTRHNATTVSRGLRYHHFEREEEDVLPETFASNVNAAYRRSAFSILSFDDSLPSAEDVAFARQARLAGLRIAYARDAVVQHKDVTTWRAEWRKHIREGEAKAHLRSLLGAPRLHLLWALAVGLLGVAAVALQNGWILGACIATFFLPTLRRVLSPVARRYAPHSLMSGAALSPFFDLAFLGGYLMRRVRARS